MHCTSFQSPCISNEVKKDCRYKRKHKVETTSKAWKIAAETRTKIFRSFCTRSFKIVHYSCFTFPKWGWKLRNHWRPTCFITNLWRQWLTRKTCDTLVVLWLLNHKKHNKEKLWIKLVASNTKLIVLVNGKLKNTVLSISTTQKQQKCHVSP